MIAFYAAATVTALVQFVRLRDKKLVPLMLLFALAAGARIFDCRDVPAVVLDFLSGAAGVIVLFLWPRGQTSPPLERPTS
jgi:hypothetical protein